MAFKKEYIRSVVFGVEDSLVSTTGLVAGMSVASDSNRLVLLAGFVAVIIESVSMGAGEYLSDDAVQEIEKIKRNRDKPLVSGVLMLASYFMAGLIPLTPFLFAKHPLSLQLSVTFAFLSLYLLGIIKGKILHTSALSGGIKIVIVGGITTILGALVGFLLKIN